MFKGSLKLSLRGPILQDVCLAENSWQTHLCFLLFGLIEASNSLISSRFAPVSNIKCSGEKKKRPMFTLWAQANLFELGTIWLHQFCAQGEPVEDRSHRASRWSRNLDQGHKRSSWDLSGMLCSKTWKKRNKCSTSKMKLWENGITKKVTYLMPFLMIQKQGSCLMKDDLSLFLKLTKKKRWRDRKDISSWYQWVTVQNVHKSMSKKAWWFGSGHQTLGHCQSDKRSWVCHQAPSEWKGRYFERVKNECFRTVLNKIFHLYVWFI